MATDRSKLADGTPREGGFTIPTTFRMTCTGVQTIPQGIPHQPRPRLKSIEPAWRLRPQRRHEIAGWLLHVVTNSADQTR
jgi:hypothetical protein